MSFARVFTTSLRGVHEYLTGVFIRFTQYPQPGFKKFHISMRTVSEGVFTRVFHSVHTARREKCNCIKYRILGDAKRQILIQVHEGRTGQKAA